MATALLTLAEKRDLCAIPVTLNGHAANICGAANLFATIRTSAPWTPENKTLSGDWQWYAVARIVSEGGAFKL
jgi:hypothetical protein